MKSFAVGALLWRSLHAQDIPTPSPLQDAGLGVPGSPTASSSTTGLFGLILADPSIATPTLSQPLPAGTVGVNALFPSGGTAGGGEYGGDGLLYDEGDNDGDGGDGEDLCPADCTCFEHPTLPVDGAPSTPSLNARNRLRVRQAASGGFAAFDWPSSSGDSRASENVGISGNLDASASSSASFSSSTSTSVSSSTSTSVSSSTSTSVSSSTSTSVSSSTSTSVSSIDPASSNVLSSDVLSNNVFNSNVLSSDPVSSEPISSSTPASSDVPASSGTPISIDLSASSGGSGNVDVPDWLYEITGRPKPSPRCPKICCGQPTGLPTGIISTVLVPTLPPPPPPPPSSYLPAPSSFLPAPSGYLPDTPPPPPSSYLPAPSGYMPDTSPLPVPSGYLPDYSSYVPVSSSSSSVPAPTYEPWYNSNSTVPIPAVTSDYAVPASTWTTLVSPPGTVDYSAPTPSADYTGDTLAGICPKTCKPDDPAQNFCDITTSCTTTGGSKYYCACRAGYMASAWNAKDFSKQFHVNGQPYVYVAPGVVCDQVCDDQTCTAVLTRPACA